MLETYQLRKSLDTNRQELSHALYQQDAACRVIARLVKERDEARAELTAVLAGANANGKRAAEDMGGDAKKAKMGISDDIIAQMKACSATLSSGRKKRQAPPGLSTVEQLAAFSELSSHPITKTTKPGITSLDISSSSPNLALAGGVDGSSILFDTAEGKKVASLGGHKKKVLSCKFLPNNDVLATSSADSTVRLWKPSGAKYVEAAVLNGVHDKAEVVAIAPHASGDFMVSLGTDSIWAFYDVQQATCVQKVQGQAPYSCGSFHPDGLLLGTGSQDSLVRIFDVKSQKEAVKFEGHSGHVSSINFSENGYYLATGASDGLKVWDLRKLKQVHSLETPGVNCVEFDYSGLYLGVGSADMKVIATKKDWSIVATYADLGLKQVSTFKFGKDANTILVAGSDSRNLKILGSAA